MPFDTDEIQNEASGATQQQTIKDLMEKNNQLEQQCDSQTEEISKLQIENENQEQMINRFRSYVENANEIIINFDLDGIVTYVSPNWKDLLGHEVSEVMSEPEFKNFIHPDDLNTVIDFFHRTITCGTKLAGAEYRVKHKGGTWRWHSTNASPIFNENGKVVSFLAFARDITNQKMDADGMADIRMRLIEAERIGKSGNWEWLPAENRVKWSEGMYNLFGIEQGTEITTEISINAFHPDDIEKLNQLTLKAMETGIPQPVEVRYFRPDGSIGYVYCTSEATLDENGTLIKMVGVYQDITDRKLNEDAINNTKRFYESLIQKAPDGVVLVSSEGLFLYASPAARQMFGFAENEPLVSNPDMNTHPDDLPMVLNALYEIIQNPSLVRTLQYRYRHMNGSYIWIESFFSNLLDEPGVNAIVINFRNITERKKAESVIIESEEKFRLLVETMKEGVVYVDNDDLIQYINQSCCDIYGYKPEDMPGKIGYQYLIHEEDRRIIFEKNKSRIDGNIDTYEVRGKKVTGELIWLRISGAPIRNAAGKVIGSVGIMSDITEHKLAEDALKHSEENYRSLFNSMIEGFALHEIICADDGKPVDYRFLMVNPSFERLTGLKGKDIIGKRVLEILPNTEHSWIEKYGNVAQTGKAITFEDYSSELNKYYKVVAFSNQTGQFAVLIDDITERKRLEEQLLASQKMDAIGRLAGGIAHDFNNLLTVILGYGEELLHVLKGNETQYSDMEEIVKAGKRASNLTRQLLTFSHKQVIQPRVMNLNEEIQDMQKMLQRLIGENICFQLELADDLKLIKIDRGQIEQIIMNLVLNARDAMPEGGTLTIKTQNIVQSDEMCSNVPNCNPLFYVIIELSDTGCGIDPYTQSKMFEPFFSTKKQGKGTGLGLSTVYGIVTQAEGRITVDSIVGAGTSIRIYLPASDEAIPQEEEIINLTDLVGKGEHILVVEDEEALCSLLKNLIEKLNYKVTVAYSGEEALKKLQNGLKADLIITDVVMPGMNGKELSDQIKAFDAEQKILFMSGFVDNSIVNQDMLGQEIPFIQKPFTSRDIAYKIKTNLTDSKTKPNNFASVLMLDDEEDIRILVQRAFSKRGHKFTGIDSVEEALALLRDNKYDILLIDMKLVGISGIDALKEIRKTGNNTPAIMYSGAVNSENSNIANNLGIIKTMEKSFNNLPLVMYVEDLIKDVT